jgi:protein tyrosine/serine phosphatase
MKLNFNHRRMLNQAAARLPDWARPGFAYLDLSLVDHGFIRSIYSNTHRVTPDLWRSSQPAPYQLRRFAGAGIRTVVNLRGASDTGSYRLEAAACERYGLTLVDLSINSRDTPSKEKLHRAQALFEDIAYPALLHCKSGADRAGLMSALYLMLREGRPVQEALRQLSLRFGHIRQARTGILDFFLEQYRDYAAATPIPFMDWVDRVYEPAAVRHAFHSRGWANLLVDRVLRHE